MSLHKYKADFSTLTPDKRIELLNRIGGMVFNSIDLNPVTQIGTFFIDESINPDSLQIPACCNLTRIYR